MILEVAILNLRRGESPAFERAIAAARLLIAATPGFRGLEVRPCVESASRYLLLVWWDKLEDHTVGFRGSARYQEWRAADRKSTRLNSSHIQKSRMPSSA